MPEDRPPDKRCKADHKKAAELIAKNVPIGEALRAAGYSDSTSQKGRDLIRGSWPLRRALKRALRTSYDEFMTFGESMTPDEQEAVVRGRLLRNVLKGEDKGWQSAKLLGQDKRVNMFTADIQLGQIVVVPPKSIIEVDATADNSNRQADDNAAKVASPLPSGD